MLLRLFVLILSVNVIAACNDSSNEPNLTEIRELILEKQQQWLANGLSDYAFTYSTTPGDCPTADAFPSVQITVEDNVVVSAYAPSLEVELNTLLYPTIDQVFNIMLQNIERNPMQYSVTKDDESKPEFNNTLYYPTRFFVDMSSKNCDAIQTQITDFL